MIVIKSPRFGKSLYNNYRNLKHKRLIYKEIYRQLAVKKEKFNNITLIGMPASGKSSVGIKLSKVLDMNFVDVDDVIRKKYNMSLDDIINKYGNDGFRKIEDEINASLILKNSIISPGGSVIYGSNAMNNLKNISSIIYLELSYAAINSRIGDLKKRGVTFKDGQTLFDLYKERLPYYNKYADIVVNCMKKNINTVINEIITVYNKY